MKKKINSIINPIRIEEDEDGIGKFNHLYVYVELYRFVCEDVCVCVCVKISR